MVQKSRVKKFRVEKFMAEISRVEMYMVDNSGIEKFLLALGFKSLGLKLRVENAGFEISWNQIFGLL